MPGEDRRIACFRPPRERYMTERPTYQELRQQLLALEKELSHREQVETALRESEDRYRRVVENSLSAIILYRQQEILFANKPFTRMFGYEPAELRKLIVDDLIAPEDAQRVSELRKRRLAGEIESAAVYESRGKRKSGEIFEMEISVCVVSHGGEPCCLAFLSDISRRKKVEEALRESEIRFRNLFELSPNAIGLADLATGRIIDANDQFCALTKFPKEELIGRTTTEIELYSKCERDKFLERLRSTGEVHGLEMDFRIKDGSTIHTLMFSRIIPISAKPMILTILFDMTGRKKLEKQLQHAQKMEAIGTLAGGIAHDFNNLLMAIQGNASLILTDLDESHPGYPKIKNIEKIVKSGARLTGQLLGYARKGKYEVKLVDLNQIVKEASDAFESTKDSIRIRTVLAPNLLRIEADPGQMEQVLMNLFANAADAMDGKGVLLVETGNIRHTSLKDRPYNPKPGDYIELKVEDMGSGMNRETIDRIFEPFFTTKKMGRGTGLGLASVYGIVKAHGGYIDVESKVRLGTIFRIYIPAKPLGFASLPIPRTK